MKTANIYAPGEWGTLAQRWRDHLLKSIDSQGDESEVPQ